MTSAWTSFPTTCGGDSKYGIFIDHSLFHGWTTITTCVAGTLPVGSSTVILGNKIDIPIATLEDELWNTLGLYSRKTYGREPKKDDSGVRPVEPFTVSVVKRMGYADVFQWLAQFLS